jgi:NAD(P)-dependent dehydrogenase (short-subunit alcohol dehydrogenase family)
MGLTAVRRLAAAGHRVFSFSRNPGRTTLPAGAVPVACDLGSADCAAVLEEVVAEAGGIDALVNNAGTGEIAAIEDGSDERAREILEVNLLGPMRLARAAIPHMRGRGGGHIVNVTSLNDTIASPFAGWYSASKAGFAAVSYALAAEVKQFGIRVTVISPGLFATDLIDGLTSFDVAATSPYRRFLEQMRLVQAERVKTAADPDQVGAAIEAVINDDDPPVRVVVGDDAKAMMAQGFDPNVHVPMNADRITTANAST